MSEHVRRERRRDSQVVRSGYEAARRAYELGTALRFTVFAIGVSTAILGTTSAGHCPPR